MRLWHGGIPGLHRGDLIEPPAAGDQRHLVRGCPVCEARKAGRPSDYDVNHRFDRVYVTTDRFIAKVFAAGYPNGALYRIEAIGELEPDPEHEQSWAVPAARVLAVVDGYVRLTRGDQRRALRLMRAGPLWDLWVILRDFKR